MQDDDAVAGPCKNKTPPQAVGGPCTKNSHRLPESPAAITAVMPKPSDHHQCCGVNKQSISVMKTLTGMWCVVYCIIMHILYITVRGTNDLQATTKHARHTPTYNSDI